MYMYCNNGALCINGHTSCAIIVQYVTILRSARAQLLSDHADGVLLDRAVPHSVRVCTCLCGEWWKVGGGQLDGGGSQALF